MKFPDESHGLRVELDAKGYELLPATIAQFERGINPLRRPVEKFPVKVLYITVYCHPQTRNYRVKTALVLSGRTLATGDLDENLYTAFERCIRKLMQKLEAYKSSLSAEEAVAKAQKGTHQDVTPSYTVSDDQIMQAVENDDYGAFRRATYSYEEALRKRVGRWIQRYPKVEAELGEHFQIDDIVEEVFLNAFEHYRQRPRHQTFGAWLEQLIDPSIKLMLKNPEEELENISFAKTLQTALEENDLNRE